MDSLEKNESCRHDCDLCQLSLPETCEICLKLKPLIVYNSALFKICNDCLKFILYKNNIIKAL